MTLLWTVVPDVQVWSGYGRDNVELQLVHYGAVAMLVVPLGDGTGRIERLLSPRPADYLRPDWQPGTRVRLPIAQ